MPYNDNIQQTEMPEFIELYEFYGTTTTELKLTSYYKDITDNTLGTYKSVIIQRDKINTSLKIREQSINISVYVKEDLSEKLISRLITPTQVKIIRYFPLDQTYKVIFIGYVSSVNVSSNVIVMKVDSLIGLENKVIPVIHYQAQCNNSLFDNRCGVNKSLHSVLIPAGELTKVSETEFTHPSIGTKSDGYFLWGVVEAGNDFRMIINHIGNTITIQYPFDVDITQLSVLITAGCNKTIGDCRNKFNNEQNFLGFPYIPRKNPVVWGL